MSWETSSTSGPPAPRRPATDRVGLRRHLRELLRLRRAAGHRHRLGHRHRSAQQLDGGRSPHGTGHRALEHPSRCRACHLRRQQGDQHPALLLFNRCARRGQRNRGREQRADRHGDGDRDRGGSETRLRPTSATSRSSATRRTRNAGATGSSGCTASTTCGCSATRPRSDATGPLHRHDGRDRLPRRRQRVRAVGRSGAYLGVEVRDDPARERASPLEEARVRCRYRREWLEHTIDPRRMLARERESSFGGVAHHLRIQAPKCLERARTLAGEPSRSLDTGQTRAQPGVSQMTAHSRSNGASLRRPTSIGAARRTMLRSKSAKATVITAVRASSADAPRPVRRGRSARSFR